MACELIDKEDPISKIRKLATLSHNKVCGDCNIGRSVSTNATIGTFVCSDCGNVLRSLVPPHRIQSLLLTNYSVDDYEFFRIHGNEMCKKIWLKYFNPQNEYYSHKIDDRMRVQYLSDKYVNKRWLAKDEDFEQIKHDLSPGHISLGSKKPVMNSMSSNYRKCIVSNNFERPILSAAQSRASSIYDANEATAQKPNDNKLTIQEDNSFDPFNQNDTPSLIKSDISVECIFSNDPFGPNIKSAKSENNLFDDFRHTTNNGLNNIGNKKLESPFNVESFSTSQLDSHNHNMKSHFNTDFNSTLVPNPFSMHESGNLDFGIKNSSNILKKNGSVGDIFGAASVTERTRNSISSPFDKSAASTTFSHSANAADMNSSNVEKQFPFNPFESTSEVPLGCVHPNKPPLNCSLNVFPSGHNNSNLANNHNNLFNQSNFNSSFNPHITSTQSQNVFSTINQTSSSSKSEMDLFSATSAFHPIHASNSATQNFSTAGTYQMPPTTKDQSFDSTYNGLKTASNDNQHFSVPSNNFFSVTPNSMAFSSFNNTHSEWMTSSMNNPINNIPFNSNSFGQSHNYLHGNNNTFSTNSHVIGGHMHNYGSNGDLYSDTISSRTGSKYDTLRQLPVDNPQKKPLTSTPELAHFDDLDAFQALGFSKLPVLAKPAETKKLTLSQMASKSSLDTISSTMK